MTSESKIGSAFDCEEACELSIFIGAARKGVSLKDWPRRPSRLSKRVLPE
jgi:hypothetical protein